MSSTVCVPVHEKLNMPMVAFGTWQVPAEQAQFLVRTALKVGYTHIDCAHLYANEKEIGKVFGEVSDRKSIYVTSKLWCNSHEPSKVRKAFQTTLDDLNCQYLDMYLIHVPVRTAGRFEYPTWIDKAQASDTWREMVKLKEAGLCKNVGVSNFTTKKLGWLLDSELAPSNNQVEMHPYLRQDKLYNFCKDHGIVLTAYSPLGSPGLPKSIPTFVDLSNPVLLEDPTIVAVAKSHNATPAQVLLKWGICRQTPVLPKSSSEARMRENLESVNLHLTEEDMKAINQIKHQTRYLNFNQFCTEEGQSVEEFWDGEFIN